MKYYTIGIICLLIFSVHSINASNRKDSVLNNQRSVFLKSGMYRYASIDELYAMHVYSGQGLLWSVGIEKQKKWLTSTTLNFSMFDRYPIGLSVHESTVGNDHRLRVINNLHFDVNDSYCLPINLTIQNLKAFLAINWFTSFDLIMNQGMLPELLLSTIAPGVYIEYRIKKHCLNGSLSSSLVSYTCRNNYSNIIIQDFEQLSFFDFIIMNSRIQLPNSLQSAFMQFNYSYDLGEKWSLMAGYNFRYIHNSVPRTMKSVSGNYNLGIAYKFKQK